MDFLIITLISLMRPYFMVFLLLPGMLWVRRSKLTGHLGTALITVINLLGYKIITYFFAAPYFYSSMATDFIEAFKKEGLVADGEKREIPWKALSALPDGVGISCCLPQYIAENIDELKGRYIIAISNGGTDLLCQEKEMELLMREESFVLYKRY